jgi:hypothetical protein
MCKASADQAKKENCHALFEAEDAHIAAANEKIRCITLPWWDN